MKIKICGMKYAENLKEVAELQPDYLGFIFYPQSKRFMAETLSPNMVNQLPKNISKTGVFVDADEKEILETGKQFTLDTIQLHGNESVELCNNLKEKSFSVIKAFSIESAKDLEQTIPYENNVDFFLFDTKGKLPGGNGFAFDWEVLADYNLETPFFLSGGIGIENLEALKKFNFKKLIGVDANSQLEIEPGLKDIKKTGLFIKTIRDYERNRNN